MIKKICFCASLCLVGFDVWASPTYMYGYHDSYYKVQAEKYENACNKTLAFEYKGKKYYIKDIDNFLKNNKSDACVQGINNVNSLYETLLGACRDGLSRLEDKYGTTVLGKNISWAVDRQRMSGHSAKDALCYCLLEREKLQKKASTAATEYSMHIPANPAIQTCVNSIKVNPNPNTCPVGGLYVEDAKYLEKLDNLKSFFGQTYQFSSGKQSNKDMLVGVYNGYILVICNGAKAEYIVKPTFSGFEKCQGATFESLPGEGSIPDGVYMARFADLERMNGKSARSWGDYRIPLIPAKTTQTYGRSNMYLHGTQNAAKRRSGGCVSMGINIKKFVEEYLQKTQRNILLIVNKVDVVDQPWNK